MSDYKQLLEAVGTALGTISTVTNLPGVDLIPYVSTIAKVVKYAQIALDAGGKVAPYVEALTETFSGGMPSQEQIDALDAKIEEMHAEIQAFDPKPEPDEPE